MTDRKASLKQSYDSYIRFWLNYHCWKSKGFQYQKKSDKRRYLILQQEASDYVDILKREESGL